MGVTMDTSNVPNNFGVIIRDSFRKFTDGTKEEYRYEDKLRFIYCCVAYMSRSKDADEAVQDIILSETKRRMSEDGEFPNKSDFESLEFMSICYEIGQKSAKLCSNEYGCDKHDNEAALKLLASIVKALEEDGKGYYKVLFKGCDWFAEIHITHLDIPAEELILKL